MEDIVIVESNDYAQVLFDDVQECYGEHKDLTCHFTLNEFLEIDKNDFIGIYKVGFIKHKDHVVLLNIDISEINEHNKGKLVFAGDLLFFSMTFGFQIFYVQCNNFKLINYHVMMANSISLFTCQWVSKYVVRRYHFSSSVRICPITLKLMNMKPSSSSWLMLLLTSIRLPLPNLSIKFSAG
jgi:hypothetical protein